MWLTQSFSTNLNESHLLHWLLKHPTLKVSVKDVTKSGLTSLPVRFCHLQPHFLLHSLSFSETRERNHRGAFHFCFEKKEHTCMHRVTALPHLTVFFFSWIWFWCNATSSSYSSIRTGRCCWNTEILVAELDDTKLYY